MKNGEFSKNNAIFDIYHVFGVEFRVWNSVE